MSATSAQLVERRATLLLEQFLLDLGATYVTQLEGDDVGFDAMAFFTSKDGSTRVIAIELKATEREVDGRYALATHSIKRLAGMNIPALIVVADVKRNEVFYAWAKEVPSGKESPARLMVSLQRADEQGSAALRRAILGAPQLTSAAGSFRGSAPQ